MTYISARGTIEESPPFGISSMVKTFWEFLDFVCLFFQTLVNPNFTNRGNGYTSGSYRPGPRPPRPPQRRMGGINRGGIDMSACAMGGGG